MRVYICMKIRSLTPMEKFQIVRESKSYAEGISKILAYEYGSEAFGLVKEVRHTNGRSDDGQAVTPFKRGSL